MKNLREITPKLLMIELGQEVYIPDSYYNPLSFLKKGCPLWIKINNEGDCIVHIISDENHWEEEIDEIIRENFEKSELIICDNILPKHLDELSIHSQNPFNLNSVAIDGNGKIKAAIIIERGAKGRMEISYIYSNDEKALNYLATHIRYNKDNLGRFHSQCLWYVPNNENDYTSVLGMTRKSEEESFWQFE